MHQNSVTRKDYTPLIIFTNHANIFAYMTIIVRSMYNFVNCLQFNIRYEKVGSWIIEQLIQAYHQYGVGSHPSL